MHLHVLTKQDTEPKGLTVELVSACNANKHTPASDWSEVIDAQPLPPLLKTPGCYCYSLQGLSTRSTPPTCPPMSTWPAAWRLPPSSLVCPSC
jgi:hypothetical protein